MQTVNKKKKKSSPRAEKESNGQHYNSIYNKNKFLPDEGLFETSISWFRPSFADPRLVLHRDLILPSTSPGHWDFPSIQAIKCMCWFVCFIYLFFFISKFFLIHFISFKIKHKHTNLKRVIYITYIRICIYTVSSY